MPAVVSDIHEISVIIGIIEDKISTTDEVAIKYKIFVKYAHKYGQNKISITLPDFTKKVDVFDRGIVLAKELLNKFNLEGNAVKWVGLEEYKKDSSDIYSDGIGISLKDSSKIVRNNGFEQLLTTFCETTLKTFKDPFWEFSPSLSAEFLSTVIQSSYESGFLDIRSNQIIIDKKKVAYFEGDIQDLLKSDLPKYAALFTKATLKKCVKEFSTNGDLDKLLKVRRSLVKDVQEKLIGVLREGLIQNPKYVGSNFKVLLQYSKKKKYFGLSSSKLTYAGNIPKAGDVHITPNKIYTEDSKLTNKTTGLQINIYTDIKINHSGLENSLKLQNQLRYKHRTFSCAPEANLHILSYDDWKKVYPS